MVAVKGYLDEMEVPAYFTNLMMTRNSQGAYIVAYHEVNDENHPLEGYVPSIEEITLSKCKVGTKADFAIVGKINKKGSSASSKELALKKEHWNRIESGVICQHDVVDKMRDKAFAREFPGKHW